MSDNLISRIVQRDENAFKIIDELDEATDRELGIVTEHSLSKERRYFVHARGPVWISYVPRVDVYGSYPTDDVLDTIRVLDVEYAVVPVDRMPIWGDNSLQDQEIF